MALKIRQRAQRDEGNGTTEPERERVYGGHVSPEPTGQTEPSRNVTYEFSVGEPTGQAEPERVREAVTTFPEVRQVGEAENKAVAPSETKKKTAKKTTRKTKR